MTLLSASASAWFEDLALQKTLTPATVHWSEVSGVKAFLLEERSDWDVDLVYHVREGGYRVQISGGYGIHIHQTPRYSKNYPQQSNPSRGLPAERAPSHWVLAQANSDTELRHRALHIMSFSRRLWGTGGRNPWDNVDRGAAIGNGSIEQSQLKVSFLLLFSLKRVL